MYSLTIKTITRTVSQMITMMIKVSSEVWRLLRSRCQTPRCGPRSPPHSPSPRSTRPNDKTWNFDFDLYFDVFVALQSNEETISNYWNFENYKTRIGVSTFFSTHFKTIKHFWKRNTDSLCFCLLFCLPRIWTSFFSS